MSDARDTNRDGHVSFVEKVKDKLHLGHKNKDAEYTATHSTTTTAHHTTPIVGASGHHTTPVVGTVPVAGAMPIAGAMPLAGAAMPLASGAGGRDLNHDGHISTTEKLATAGPHSSNFNSGLHDSRDLNRDGHVSTSEKLAAGAHMGANFQKDEAHLKLHEEQLAISKREVAAGEVDIHKRVQQEHVQQTIPVRREEVTVERHPLHGVAEPGARIAAQDEVVRVPLYREEIVTEKRLVPTEEVIVRKKEVMDQQTVGANLRSEYVETAQTGINQNFGSASTNTTGAFDARDTNRDGHVSMDEKLKGGNAHSNTGAFDARDTNRDGHVSLGEKLKGGNATAVGADRRDLNGDGHVSMGEKLKTADANGDGRVTMGEKIKAARG